MKPQAASDDQLDAILASVRHCSKADIWERIQYIDFLLEKPDGALLISAAERMERLNDRLLTFARSSRAEAYERARQHLLSSWRHVMRGNYPQARAWLAHAADCCDDMV